MAEQIDGQPDLEFEEAELADLCIQSKHEEEEGSTEVNPEVIVEQPDLQDLANALPVESWKTFGRKLLISEDDLTVIEAEQPNLPEKRFQVFYKWYQGCEGQPTYGKLIETARLVGCNRAADSMKKLALEKIDYEQDDDKEKQRKITAEPCLTENTGEGRGSPESDRSVSSPVQIPGTEHGATAQLQPLEQSQPLVWSRPPSSSSLQRSTPFRGSPATEQPSSAAITDSLEGGDMVFKDSCVSRPIQEENSEDDNYQDAMPMEGTPLKRNRSICSSLSTVYKFMQSTDSQQSLCSAGGSQDPVQESRLVDRKGRPVLKHQNDMKQSSIASVSDSPDPTKDKTEFAFGVLNFWVYRKIDEINTKFPHAAFVLQVSIGLSLIFQFFSSLLTTYFEYASQRNGSFIMHFSLPLVTRLIAKVGLPSILAHSVVTIASKRLYTPDSRPRLRKEIEQPDNEAALKQVFQTFFKVLDITQKSPKEALSTIRAELCENLKIMTLTSIVKGVVFPVSLYGLGALVFPKPENISLVYSFGLCDALSTIILLCVNGVGFAFFFHEITLRRHIACVLKISEFRTVELSDALHKSSKKTLNCLFKEWTFLEMFLSTALVVNAVISVSLASAGASLSGGCAVKDDMQVALKWLLFICVFLLCHVLSTAIYCCLVLRTVGTICEMVLAFCLLFLFKPVPCGGFLQILHILYPGVYIFWYFVAMIKHEYIFLFQKTNSRAKHKRRCYRSFGMLGLHVFAFALIIFNEFRFICCSNRTLKDVLTSVL